MKSAVLFGTQTILAEELSKTFNLIAIVTEKARVTKELQVFCIRYNIKLVPVIKFSDIPKIKADIGICFGFGLIFSDAFLKTNPYPIINIHPGSLKTNRGRHPLHWNIFLNELETHVVFHLITQKLDEGPLLFETSFYRDPTWNLCDLEDTVLSIAVNNVCQVAQEYIQNKKTQAVITGGTYRPRFVPPSEIIPTQIDSKELIALTKIQIKYGGILIENNLYTDAKISTDIDKNWQIFRCKDNMLVAMKKKEI